MKTISTLMLAAAFLFARPAFAGVDTKGDEAPKAEKKSHKKAEKKDEAAAEKKDEKKEDKKEEKKDEKKAEKKDEKKEKGGW
jgi:flagellar biosynthesis/type III secretory pathway M-ring protein FliF/YscJ